ncbi:MAG TPA: alpha/beta fold hydrolase [Allosphingosinicella sp.]
MERTATEGSLRGGSRLHLRLTVLGWAALLAGCAATPQGLAGPPDESRNQTTVALPSAEELASWQSMFAAAIFKARGDRTLPYRIYRPASASRRPLVLILHASGALGSDNAQQLGPFAASWARPELAHDPPVVVVPQVAERSVVYARSSDGVPKASSPGPSFAMLAELLEDLLRDPTIDKRRVYLVGFSMGGSAALQLALSRSRLVSAIFVFAPVPPPIGRAGELAKVPIFAVHGEADEENPFAVSLAFMNNVKAKGGDVRLISYRGMGHRMPSDMLVDPGWRRQLLSTIGSARP